MEEEIISNRWKDLDGRNMNSQESSGLLHLLDDTHKPLWTEGGTMRKKMSGSTIKLANYEI